MVPVNQTSGWWKLGPWKTSQVGRCPSHALELLLVCPGREQGAGGDVKESFWDRALCPKRWQKTRHFRNPAEVVFPVQAYIGLLGNFDIFPPKMASSQSVVTRQAAHPNYSLKSVRTGLGTWLMGKDLFWTFTQADRNFLIALCFFLCRREINWDRKGTASRFPKKQIKEESRNNTALINSLAPVNPSSYR